MDRIFYCGEIHGDFVHATQAVCKHRPAAILLAVYQQGLGTYETAHFE